MFVTPPQAAEPDEKGGRYHVTTWDLNNASDEQFEKWATDPLCIERDVCAERLAERDSKKDHAARVTRALARARGEGEPLKADPFDPRTEVSADARHIADRIIKHLWILFVLLPFIIAFLLAVVDAIK